MGNCVFCKMISGEIPIEKLAENDDAFVIRDRDPQAAVHVLVVAKWHIESLNDAFKRQRYDLTDPFDWVGPMSRLAMEWATKNLPNGYRLVTNVGADAGQLVKHLHFHVLGGETLKGI